MRFDEANEAGGINGRKVRLIVEDNGSQPQLAVRAVDKLIRSDDVFAIVNAFGSGTNAAVVKRAVDAGVLYFSPWGAAAVLQKIAGNSRGDQLTGRHWQGFARECGLGVRQVLARVRTLTQAALAQAEAAAADVLAMPAGGHPILELAREAIEQRARTLFAHLAEIEDEPSEHVAGGVAVGGTV